LWQVEEEYTHREHMKRVQNQMDIVAQIRTNENKNAKQKLEKARAIEGAHEAESTYMSMVNAHHEEPVRWFGRRAVQWYD
jgi:thioester reductase-like protein